jgi:asparagine N-glycosylation enzyme membrane subunit Stt3
MHGLEDVKNKDIEKRYIMAEQKQESKLELLETVPSKLSSTLSRGNEIIICVFLFLAAFGIRMLTYSSIFVGDSVRFLEFDPFYHMRRVVSFAQNFPNTWNFDSYLNYPYGSVVGWGPLYDWTIALLANIVGLGHPSRHLIETVGVYFPVFVGSLSVIAVYFAAKEIFSELGNVQRDNKESDNKEYGNKEYGVTKTTKKSRKARNIQTIEKAKGVSWKNVKGWQIGLISGLILVVIPAFTQVSFLGFVDHHVAEVLLSTTTFLFFIKTLKAESSRNRYKFSVLTGFVLALAMLVWPGAPIFIGIIAIYGMVQCAIDKKYKYLALIIGALSIFYVGAYFIAPDTYNGLNSGIGFLIKDRIELQQVQETQPLFFTFAGKFTTESAWHAFGAALYVAMIGLILLISSIIKNRPYKDQVIHNRIKMFLLVWTLIVLVMNLYQTRFVYLFAVNVGILCAYLIVELINSNKIYLEVIGLFLVGAILIPSVQMDNIMRENPLMLSNDWFTTSEWIKNNTPVTNSTWNMPSMNQIPSYGIMSWWDYGNYLLYLSERPVIANNFQLGAEDSAKFYTSENESDANNILNSRKARYVVVDYRLGLNVFNADGKTYIGGSWVSAAFLSGKNMSYYLDQQNMPNKKYFDTMYARLYIFDGKGLDKYKLVHKSETVYQDIFGKPVEEIKVFEYTG